MAFALPPLIFVVFATAFSSSGGSDLKLRLAAFDAARTPGSASVLRAVVGGGFLAGRLQDAESVAELRTIVRRGAADAGLVVSNPDGSVGPPVTVVVDPSKAMANSFLLGALERVLAPLAPDANGARGVAIVVENATPGGGRATLAAYYAAGVTTMFLLFSAIQSAMTLIEERASGVLDRVLAGPGGASAIVFGKFAFLVIQGALQCAVIFVVAWAAYGVDPLTRPGPWLATTMVASASAAALALALIAFCRTRQQAQAASTFLILLVSAVGGSMAPRFTMPTWLQDLGWLTPNAWIIEAYQDTLWRGEAASTLIATWAVLLMVTAAGLVVAVVTVHRSSS